MRQIEFRGKRTDNGEWVYGDFSKPTNIHFCIRERCSKVTHYVLPETVGQYTGLKDKNGVKIFEGDVVRKLKLYPEFQTHYGENIPLGKYTEQIDTDIVWEETIVEWMDSGLWNISIDNYTIDEWINYEKENDNEDPIKREMLEMFGLPLGAEGEALEFINDSGFEFESFEDAISSYSQFEVIGNIHE